ncbi:MAG: ATP phosphoribosyltransferase [Rubrimonas sp.]|uniref:ATP phosphoribosyltransferase n=1 Tax=Rubrimonas sp. TaxID=2036015 RepID=UPI002FDCD030
MLKLGLPSKGRLQEQSIEAFAEFGLAIERQGAEREYSGRLNGAPDVALTLMSAGEIPAALAAGEIHLGVTGLDLIAERIPDAGLRAPVLAKLGFGHADLIVAVPACWADVETMHDLDEVAAQFRARHGRPIRVATKYHQLARRFFAQSGVADYRLVDSQGATEAGPRNLTCEAIVDITSSGETLRANHLRILEDGLILRSEAVLALARGAGWDERSRRALGELGRRIGFDAETFGL